MANGRKGRKNVDTERMPGGFCPIPWSVLDSMAYLGLSHPARSLLLEVARQDVRSRNGQQLLSGRHLSQRGWNSNDTISRAKSELLKAKLIHETVKGYRPNKASWYAVTWFKLYKHPRFDEGAFEEFRLGAYLDFEFKNAGLKPSRGTKSILIAPPKGVSSSMNAP